MDISLCVPDFSVPLAVAGSDVAVVVRTPIPFRLVEDVPELDWFSLKACVLIVNDVHIAPECVLDTANETVGRVCPDLVGQI